MSRISAKFDRASIARLRRAYEAGTPMTALETRFHASGKTIRTILEREGVELRPARRERSEEELDRAVRAGLRQGYGVSGIAAVAGVGYERALAVAKRIAAEHADMDWDEGDGLTETERELAREAEQDAERAWAEDQAFAAYHEQMMEARHGSE